GAGAAVEGETPVAGYWVVGVCAQPEAAITSTTAKAVPLSTCFIIRSPEIAAQAAHRTGRRITVVADPIETADPRNRSPSRCKTRRSCVTRHARLPCHERGRQWRMS